MRKHFSIYFGIGIIVLMLTGVLSFMLFSNRATVQVPPELYECYDTGDTGTMSFYGSSWQAQTFTVGTTEHTVTSISFLIYRTGNPGTVIYSIRATDESGHPTGNDLTSDTFNGNFLEDYATWFGLSVPEYSLSANTKYAIVLRAPDGDASNCINWRFDDVDPEYTDGDVAYSNNSGSSWTSYTGFDYMFNIWGNPK